VLSAQAGILIKSGRALKGMKQAELAHTAGVSRTVLSRLESGKAVPVQTDVLDRLLGALGIEPALIGESAAKATRRRVRLEQQNRLERQRNRHLRVAIALASDKRAARLMIEKARARVQLWRDKRSCSPFYIKRWSAILSLPPMKMAGAIASLGDWEDAMFQNSPWSWAWN
jgi:transcriptional regulator with XRE-family HTH domain